jgi:hypothetical protein
MATVTAETVPLWSADLPAPDGMLTVDAQGDCLVSSRNRLDLVTTGGRLAWTAYGDDSWEPPVVGPEGEVHRVEGDRVVSRSPQTGTPTGSFRVGSATHLAADPWGGLIFRTAERNAPAGLCSVTSRGEVRWTAPLTGRGVLLFAPVVFGAWAVVHAGGSLRAYGRDGRVHWVADRGGLRAPDPAGDRGAAPGGDEPLAAPVLLDAATLLVALRWYDGRGFFRVDLATGTVDPFAAWLPAQTPFAVLAGVPPLARPAVALRGPSREVRRLEWESSVVLLDESGRELWERSLPVEPGRLMASPDGTLVVSASPSRSRWDQYHQWQDLSREAFVQWLEPSGARRWTWYAPGPLSHLPVIRPDGVVYVGSDGRLWALPPSSTVTSPSGPAT